MLILCLVPNFRILSSLRVVRMVIRLLDTTSHAVEPSIASDVRDSSALEVEAPLRHEMGSHELVPSVEPSAEAGRVSAADPSLDRAPPVADRLLPWDPARWPNIPVPYDDRHLPEYWREGPRSMRCPGVVETIAPGGKHAEGAIFVRNGVRMRQFANGAFVCDESGRKLTAKSILRPPSYTATAWGQLLDPELRRRAWVRFWKGEDLALAENSQAAASSRVAASLRACAMHSPSFESGLVIGCYCAMALDDLATVRASLAAIAWGPSRRSYVPGDGFCVGASCMPHKSYFSHPRTAAQRVAVLAINRLVRTSCHDSFVWTSLQFNRNTVAKPHTDKNNIGLSFILVLGDYSGGSLHVPCRGVCTPPGSPPLGLYIDGRRFTTRTPLKGSVSWWWPSPTAVHGTWTRLTATACGSLGSDCQILPSH